MVKINGIKRPFFSVLMPVYNAEKYLKRAIDSVLAQTFQDFELILIDDCSTDKSSEILSEYKKVSDKVILARTKENLGVANARNEGIKYVHGHYLTFVDSDDYIEPELFEKVKNVIDRTGAQLIKYSVVEQYYNEEQQLIGKKNVCLPDIVYTNANDVRKAVLPMEKLPLFGYLWNSFYSLETITKHLWNFDKNMQVNEDFMMNINLIDYVEIMACMSYIGYHYEKRESASLSTRRNNQYYKLTKVKIETLLNKYREWHLLDEKVEQEIYWLYIRIVYSTICRELEQGSWKQAKQKLENTIYRDTLFAKFSNAGKRIRYTSVKEQYMFRLLYYRQTTLIVLLCFSINQLKTKFKVLFAKLKD